MVGNQAEAFFREPIWILITSFLIVGACLAQLGPTPNPRQPTTLFISWFSSRQAFPLSPFPLCGPATPIPLLCGRAGIGTEIPRWRSAVVRFSISLLGAYLLLSISPFPLPLNGRNDVSLATPRLGIQVLTGLPHLLGFFLFPFATTMFGPSFNEPDTKKTCRSCRCGVSGSLFPIFGSCDLASLSLPSTTSNTCASILIKKAVLLGPFGSCSHHYPVPLPPTFITRISGDVF